MGLLSGGQILSLKRSVSGSKDEGGDDIFHFEPPHTVASLKKSLKAAAEEFGGNLDSQTQELVINEGTKVFELNNTLINSVDGVNEAFWRLALWALAILVVLALLAPLIAFAASTMLS